MTNAEKLAKDAETVESIMAQISDIQCFHLCDYCIYRFKNCSGNCEYGVKEWIESEAEEDGKIH